MIPLTRGAPPTILADKAEEWTRKYLERRQTNPSLRPPKAQYRHDEVLLELRRMSGGKCFYCERKLADAEQEVDHHVEVAERPELAFDWWNLYLACPQCNRDKTPNAQVPCTSCVDPCSRGAQPVEHLTFVDERIEPLGDSAQGRNTIRKYRLDRQDLDLARARAIREFDKALDAVRQRQIAEGRKSFSDADRALLWAFTDPARPFSLMMAVLLRRLDG